jgi:flagellar biogenesis protein FliO
VGGIFCVVARLGFPEIPVFIGVSGAGTGVANHVPNESNKMIARFHGRETSAGATLLWRWRRTLGPVLFALTTLSAFGTDLTSPIASTNALPTPPLPDMASAASSIFRVLGALAIVLAVFFGGVWLFRNWQRTVSAKGQMPKLNILETKSLGQRHALYVVGYEQQRLLIAASPAGVTMLTPLPAAVANATEETPASKPGFGDVLRQALQRKS